MEFLGWSVWQWGIASAVGTMTAAMAAAATVFISAWQTRASLKLGRQQLTLDQQAATEQIAHSRDAATQQFKHADRAARAQLEQHREAMAAQGAQAARVLLEQNRPYVVVSFESSQPMMNWIELVISNVGKTPAYDIHFTTDKPMLQADDACSLLSASRMFTEGMRMLAPGAQVRAVFDDMTERCAAGLNMRYEMTVDYRNSQGDSWQEVMALDLDDRHDLTFFEVFNTHHVAQALRDVRDTMRSWKAMKSGQFDAVVEEREANHQRLTEEHEARLQAVGRMRRNRSTKREEVEESP